jgi:glyoxylase-like metal-dependent hydrolase (beta-lactamase superfamily II)
MRVEKILHFDKVKGLRVGYAPIGKPLICVIVYYVDGLLIDSGAYNTRKSVKKFVTDNNVEQVALTHYHEDHAGNAGFLKKYLEVPIYGHPLTIENLKNNVRLKPYEYYLFGRLEQAEISPLPQIIETTNYSFTPVHTPGHSQDHIVYHEKNEGWVFSGDLFLGPKIKYFRKDEDIVLTIKSLYKLLSLDFDYLFCGHNPKMNKPKIYIQSKVEQMHLLMEEVNILINKGYNDREVLKILTKGQEAYSAIVFTLGDVSYKNMVKSALHSLRNPFEGNSILNDLTNIKLGAL